MLRRLFSPLIAIAILILAALNSIPTVSRAEAHALYARQSSDEDVVTSNELADKIACFLRYGYFTDDGMNEAYTNYYGFIISINGEDLMNYELKKGVWWSVRMATGLSIAEGEPLRWYSEFDIVDERLSMVALPIEFTMMRQLSDFNRNDIMTYWGLGFCFFLGFERMECHVTKQTITGTEHYEWNDTCYRHSFAGHGLIGINWNVNEKFSVLCELRWTLGGKGRLKRAELSKQQILECWEEVFEDFQHPDFNFTGASIDIGVKW